MSDWKTEARIFLCESFVFLIENIHSFPPVESAASEGYEIRFHDSVPSDEMQVPANIGGSIWDIPQGTTYGDERNDHTEILKTLHANLPSMSVILMYRVRRRRLPGVLLR